MIWLFALLLGLALVFFKLGSASVWIGLLTLGMKVSFAVIVFLVISVIWQKFKAKKIKLNRLRGE